MDTKNTSTKDCPTYTGPSSHYEVSHYEVSLGFCINGSKEEDAVKELESDLTKIFAAWKLKWNKSKKVKIARDSITW